MTIDTRRIAVAAAALALVPALHSPAQGLSLGLLDGRTSAHATVSPGAQTLTDGAQCTSNFVFADTAGAVYLGQAAHCGGLGGATDTNGCEAESLPLGTLVDIAGASRPGRLAYSSWETMQRVGEDDPNACAFNDLALVRVDPADVGKVNPSVPFFGGPTGVSTGTTAGELVYSYGNSQLRLGISPLSPKRGVSLGADGDGWTHRVYTVTPGVPGDSGSAVLDSKGRALGVLSTLQVLPVPGSNGVSDLRRALDYMNAHSGLPPVRLVLGTERFTPNRLL